MMETITTYRSVTMRLLPGSKSKAHALTDLAGTCRYAFNQILADVFSQIKLYVDDKENNPKPSYSYFSLGPVFTEWKKTAPEWVRDKAANVVKYNLKSISETFKRSLKTNGVYGRPQFKSKKRNGVSFNVDCASTTTKWIKGQLLNIPGLGRYRMRGSNRYSHWNLTGYTVYQKVGKWFVSLRYKGEVPVPVIDESKEVGIDVGVTKPVTLSDGTHYAIKGKKKKTRYEKRTLFLQKKLARQKKDSNRSKRTKNQLAKKHKKVANIRDNFGHQVTRKVADKHDVACVEDITLPNLTKSAKGTTENPGKNVKAKSGLNRVILDAGLGSIRSKLAYKVKKLVLVNPAYTSQGCSCCGHTDKNSRNQSKFVCTECGHKINADHNAAINILARGKGVFGQGGAVSSLVELSRRCTVEVLV